MSNQDKIELQIVLKRAKYVLVSCVVVALVVVMLLIFKL